MAIALRNKNEIEAIRAANRLVARSLELMASMVKAGVTTKEISDEAERFLVSNGARPSFKGLYTPPFPAGLCASKNEVIIHGVPDETPLKEGDIVGLDFGAELNGWYGDAAVTLPVGKISQKDEKLIACAKDTLYEAIDAIKVGMRFKELSAVLENAIVTRGFTPLRGYCGHGIGRKPHEEPSILNYVEGAVNQGPKIKEGMVFCIEPMICQKSGKFKTLADRWSVVSEDGLNGSHYEHTVTIIGGKAEILSLA
ncbi:MAG: type I methionyl aminopeptidase [Helicobacteraceae bacterium]|jgi:methionyl aminopeptidase|nr:type I methionyl aminopeptidase [Helicobacteraceae bacterium]